MSSRRRVSTIVIAVLAVVAGIGAWITRPGEPATSSRSRVSGYANRVDQQPLLLAQQLDSLATTRDEAPYSRQAVDVADHEIDLAFTTALRDASAHPPAPTPETKAIRDRMARCESLIAEDEAAINRIAGLKKPSDADLAELQLAEAEFVLHSNELDDAKRDLARSGGDPESWLRRQFQQHQAAMHPQQPQTQQPYVAKPEFVTPPTLYSQLRLWFQLRAKKNQLADAQKSAGVLAESLTARHNQLEKQLAADKPQGGSGADSNARIAAVERRSDDQKTLSEYDQRVGDLQELSQIYGSWIGVIQTQMAVSTHGELNGALEVLIVLLAVFAAMEVVDRLSRRLQGDRRRAATTRLLGRFAVQGVGLVAVMLLVLGPPNQLSTILALAGAGLTVALKDFIVGFFGWFVLVGKNGVRIGDWVEINGIIGEVTDIGLLRTTVMETGNWAGSGHPTGRHVTFVNSYAIEGHYFNFSTSGQWLWDTLDVFIPAGTDPQMVLEAMLEAARKETAETAHQAEQEWKRAAHGVTLREFSAEPSVELRPAVSGYTLVVHYMSSATLRFETRGRLYQAAFQLLQGTGQTRAAANKA